MFGVAECNDLNARKNLISSTIIKRSLYVVQAFIDAIAFYQSRREKDFASTKRFLISEC